MLTLGARLSLGAQTNSRRKVHRAQGVSAATGLLDARGYNFQCQPVFGSRKMLRPERCADIFATLYVCWRCGGGDSDGANPAWGFSMAFFSLLRLLGFALPKLFVYLLKRLKSFLYALDFVTLSLSTFLRGTTSWEGPRISKLHRRLGLLELSTLLVFGHRFFYKSWRFYWRKLMQMLGEKYQTDLSEI